MTPLLALLTLGAPALAEDLLLPECTEQTDRLEGAAWLRALSLDLRGVVPGLEEYALLDEAGAVPDDLIDAWLADEAFVDRAVRHHDSLLWPNVGDIRLLSNRQRLLYEDGVYYRYLVAPAYRGGPVSCGDFPATWDDDGELVLSTTPEGWIQEGWVEVNPYWAPDRTIRVCAFEAQETLVSPLGTQCDTYDGRYDPYCGCGPELRWCDTFSLGHVQEDGYVAPVHRSLAEDVRKRVGRVMREDLSYLEMLTGRTVYVNGPLVHFYRNNLNTPAHVRFNEVPVDPEQLPDLAFTDEDTWVALELGEEQSGILTSPMFLMKYQTRRARANRFYNAFLCQPFQPPDGGIPDLDAEHATLDLTRRPGCQYCHALLEPAGAHWGRWGEYGAGYLDPDAFPTFDEDCAWCAESGASCAASCREYYVIDPLTSEEDPYVGMLKSYQFLESRYESHVETGPRRLVHEGVADGRLPRCVARNTASWLLGRAPTAAEEPWIDELAGVFTGTGFRYRELVKAIVTSDNYRRVR